MQSSSAAQTTDCLGRCDNLTMEELDHITDNIHKTLTDPKGNELFASYLMDGQFSDSLACLNVYNTCSKYLTEEQNRSIHGSSSEEESKSLESLVTKVEMMQKTVFDLNEIDLSLMKQFKDALKEKTKEALLNVLENIKDQCQNCLRKMHERFRDYILRCKNTST
ncbi:uncharacterized protein LOC112468386 [Temnothorax curvispinosus]|uniref:Uncharacterized protein LOC112468386 n=1 Tax=Temnothorax curvispinosus TaxID=300111 RepID=A0A6J1RKT8_9HYME|nr:uncharacterized protein LOC112468386 [Temnothorax curvispinosus]